MVLVDDCTSGVFNNIRGLRKSHPEDQDKLEGVVEGCLASERIAGCGIFGDLRNQYTALTALSKTVRKA
jgi:hypothetical protein